MVNISVIILSFNEQENLGQALQSVAGWASQIAIVDSFSTDRTLEIARKWGSEIYQHSFEGYGSQRNWSLAEIPIRSEWVLFLDADEWLPEGLKQEIASAIACTDCNGFEIKRCFMWMGRCLNHGQFPTWLLRLFRKGKGRFEELKINEHFLVEGKVGKLRNAFIHEDRKNIREWATKHIHYATLEATELLRERTIHEGHLTPRFWGNQAERNRWLRHKIYNRFPPLLRPWFYFSYHYFARLGFLDGWQGLVYNLLRELWYPLLIDAIYLDSRIKQIADGN
jgi:glycosyltransferase involved in cell wall biosynthesis